MFNFGPLADLLHTLIDHDAQIAEAAKTVYHDVVEEFGHVVHGAQAPPAAPADMTPGVTSDPAASGAYDRAQAGPPPVPDVPQA